MPSRRVFLASTAAGAAAGALPAAAAAAPGPGRKAAWFDRGLFDRQLHEPYAHKQLFDSTKIAGGQVLSVMLNSLNAYDLAMGEPEKSLHAIAIFHGPSLVLALNDAMWAKYAIADHAASIGEKDLPATAKAANPYRRAQANTARTDAPDAATGFYRDSSFEALVARGAHFYVCNNALHGFAGALAPAGGSAAAIHEELAANLLPGALRVPAGVAAINAAQEAGFTYIAG